MKTIQVFQCLCDETRLRILNLLLEGPLCVCHLAAILKLEQPKVSRHLKALKAAGAVETERCYNWTICRIATVPNPVLEANLRCLQDLRGEERQFQNDLKTRQKTVTKLGSRDCMTLPSKIRDLCQA